MAPPTDELLQALVASPASREPYLDLAARLRSQGDVRGELIEVQLELETARGARARELVEIEEKLLTDHARELYGPLMDVGPRHRGCFTWRRGYIDSLTVPPESFSAQGHNVPLPLDKLEAALAHPSLSLCRSLWSTRRPRAIPSSVERLHVRQAVIGDDLLLLPSMRELRIETIVASTSLVNDRLTTLSLPLKGPVLDVLEKAELPSLETLTVTDGFLHIADPARVPDALGKSRARRFALAVRGQPAAGRPGWTDQQFAALAPLGDRIHALALVAPFVRADFSMPNLRRLRIDVQSATGHPVKAFGFETLPRVPELYMHVRALQVDPPSLGEAFVQSEVAQQLRSLHIELGTRIPALGKVPLPTIEELSIVPMGTHRAEAIFAMFDEDAFPNVRTLTLRFPQQLAPFANAPAASRVETFCFSFDGDRSVQAFLDVRDRLTSLRTLVVRGARSLSASMRAALLDVGCDVVWPEHDHWARVHWFDTTGEAPGFTGII